MISRHVLLGVGVLACLLDATAETNYVFRQRLAELHPRRLASDAALVAADETEVTADWSLVAVSGDPVVRHAREDLADYFRKSMGIVLSGDGRRRIVLDVVSETNALTSRISVDADTIRVTGATPREVYQGCCRLEDLMNTRGRPAVRRGERTFTRMFSPRMTHSGWEVESFPDVYLDQLVHAGMDAILVFIADPPDVTRRGREDIPALVERARLRGIDVYAYAWFAVKASKFHPLDPGAEAWYDATYGSIIRNAPGLKGIVCVGETSAFATRDGKTEGFWWWPKSRKPKGVRSHGWWPSLDWADWLKLVKKVTRRYNPDLDILFWTYNWYTAPEKDRLALLEKIPTDVTVHVTFELGDGPLVLDGVKKYVSDYSVTRPGPSRTFVSEAEVVRRRGIRLTSMSNTGGRTWDLGVAPYEPAPDRWIERFRAVRKAQRDYGLSGLMECHHYGFMPNPMAELAKEAFTAESDDRTLEDFLSRLAGRHFGFAHVSEVLATWKDWSEAMLYHSALGQDQGGPLRTGPSYPFVLPGEPRPEPPEPKYEYYEGERYGDGWKYLEPEYGLSNERIALYAGHLQKEIALWRRGNERLAALLPHVPEDKRAEARRMWGIGVLFERTAVTLENVRAFRLAKTAEERLKIIERERANVLAAIPAVENDSALGWEPTMEYVCDRKMLEWKLGQLETVRRRLVE